MDGIGSPDQNIHATVEPLTIPSQTPISMNFVNNGNGLLLDPNALQSILNMQAAANKPVAVSFPVEMAMPRPVIQNNNVVTQEVYSTQPMSKPIIVSMPVGDNFIHSANQIMQDGDASAKKLCPLEMSIKAADLDLEFAKENYALANGVMSSSSSQMSAPVLCNGVDAQKMALPPFTTVLRSTPGPNFTEADVSSTAYTSQIMPEPLTLTLQPSQVPVSVLPTVAPQVLPVAQEPLQVLLVRVQPQMSAPTVISTQPLIVPSTPLVFSTSSMPTYQPTLTTQPSLLTPLISTNITQVASIPSVFPLDEQSIKNDSICLQEVVEGSMTETLQEVQPTVTQVNSEPSDEAFLCEVDDSDQYSIAEESDKEVKNGEESLVLKIRKVPPVKKRMKAAINFDWDEELAKSKERWISVKTKSSKKRGRNRIEYSDDDFGWSASDDETLASVVQLHREKEEYEKNGKIFKRSPRCCSKRCYTTIPVHHQKSSFENFLGLEEKGKGDSYLATCILLPKPTAKSNKTLKKDLPKFEVDDCMSVDIAKESNGNQSLSDEIQKAIEESLRDQRVSTEAPEVPTAQKENQPEEAKTSTMRDIKWQYAIIINNKQRICCLKFLLAVLRIPSSRIQALQTKILDGEPLDRVPVIPRFSKPDKLWTVAKRHLDSLATIAVPCCDINPPHRQLLEPMTRLGLFNSFLDFHLTDVGKLPPIKYDTFRRFIQHQTNLAFPRTEETTCARCESIEGQAPYCGNNGNRGRLSKYQGDSETEDVPLAYRHLRRTSTRVGIRSKKLSEGASQSAIRNEIKRVSKKAINVNPIKKRRKKEQKKGQRGDVFSLMLSHLNNLSYKIPTGCTTSEGHKFFSPSSVTVESLYEDYRKYFLRQTNSELGLRFAIYESLFKRNPHYTIADFDTSNPDCPKCLEIVMNTKANS